MTSDVTFQATFKQTFNEALLASILSHAQGTVQRAVETAANNMWLMPGSPLGQAIDQLITMKPRRTEP